MAKVTYSGFINTVKGSLSGSTFKGNKGLNVLMNRKHPRDDKTSRQQLLRMYTSQYAGRWYSLTSVQQGLWNKYASLQGGGKSGINSYVGSNVRLKMANHVSLVEVSVPPQTPSRPYHIEGLSAIIDVNSLMTVAWTSPSAAGVFVQVWYSIGCGFTLTGKESWKYAGCVASSLGQLQVQLDVETTRPITVRVNTIDTSGRVSPHFTSTVVFAPLHTRVYVIARGNQSLTVWDADSVASGTLTQLAMIRGSLAPNYLNGVEGLHVVGNYAYCASYLDDRLTVFDVSDVANGNITHVASIGGPGSPNYCDGARDVFVSGSVAYVVSYLDRALVAFDISNAGIGTITKLADIRGAAAPNYLNGASAVHVVGNIAYVGSNLDDSFVAFDVSNVAGGVITKLADIRGGASPNFLDGPRGVDISGNVAYVACSISNALVAIDITNAGSGTLTKLADIRGVGFPNYLGGAYDVSVSGNTAFVVGQSADSLVAIDVTNVGSGTLTKLGHILGAGSPNYLNGASGVHVLNNQAFVASFVDNALTAFDVSTPASMSHLAAIFGNGAPNYLANAIRVQAREES